MKHFGRVMPEFIHATAGLIHADNKPLAAQPLDGLKRRIICHRHDRIAIIFLIGSIGDRIER